MDGCDDVHLGNSSVDLFLGFYRSATLADW